MKLYFFVFLDVPLMDSKIKQTWEAAKFSSPTDIIVMDALSHLLNFLFEDLFFCLNLTGLGKVEVLLLSFLKSRARARSIDLLSQIL